MRVLAPVEAIPRISRRALLAGLSVAGAGVLAGCGSDVFAETVAPDGEMEGRLNIYSWGDYNDPGNVKTFGKRYDVTVQLDSFASNEQMIAKLATSRGTSGYDLVVPTGNFVPMMVANGLLAKLDHDLLPNFANLEEAYRDQPWDRHNEYVVCKNWGTTGYVYDTRRIERPMTSWQDFIDVATGEASGSVSVLDDPFEYASIFLAAKGYDLNTTDAGQLAEAERFLVDEFAPHLRNFSSDPTQNIVQGDFALMQAYNGDVRLALGESDEPEHWRFVFPTPTANLWMDTWALATGARHPDAAHAWINFMLEPEVGFREMDYNGYPTGLRGQRALAEEEEVDMIDLIFPSDAVLDRLTPGLLTDAQETLVRILSRAQVKAAS